MAETDADTPAAPASTPRRWDWRSKVRWFAAEYFIVVLGVLTAVGINVWWQEQQDQDRERAYLLQIASDLRETENQVEVADLTYASGGDRAVLELIAAYHSGSQPDPDSVALWITQARGYIAPTPVMGTLNALLETGEQRLIRDDSLRQSVITYVGRMRYLNEVHQNHINRMLRAIEDLPSSVSMSAVASKVSELTGSVPEGWSPESPLYSLGSDGYRSGYGLDMNVLLDDREAYATFERMADTRSSFRGVRRRLLEPTRLLRQQIESHLAE